jgi:hypothetical protein
MGFGHTDYNIRAGKARSSLRGVAIVPSEFECVGDVDARVGIWRQNLLPGPPQESMADGGLPIRLSLCTVCTATERWWSPSPNLEVSAAT